jgi:phosphatidylglycerophosphatase A
MAKDSTTLPDPNPNHPSRSSTSPSLQFLMAHPAHLVACGFGSGLSPRAPGTVGTLFGWLSFLLLRPYMSDFELLVFIVVCFVGGVLAVHKTGVDLGVIDHGSIVWDEIVPFWLVLLFCPDNWLWQITAFCLFRFFDISKPQPARYFDEQVKNGLGVMTDDLVAAGYTLLVLAVLRFVLP